MRSESAASLVLPNMAWSSEKTRSEAAEVWRYDPRELSALAPARERDQRRRNACAMDCDA